MTRKDYQLIAEAIAATKAVTEAKPGASATLALNVLVNELSVRLIKENPQFDRTRFVNASLSR